MAKQPKFNFVPVWIVDNWQTETKKGIGHRFEKIKDGICQYEGKYLIFLDNEEVPVIVSDFKVFTCPEKASNKLLREKSDYIKFLKKDIQRQQERLKEIQ